MNVRIEDYESNVENAWCPGCGNFAILNSMKNALVELNLSPQKVLMVSGIGQAPKLPHYLKVNTFNGLHGREVAAATGAKLAADDLTVIVHAGEGGAYGEGGNHLLHAIRRNIDITIVVHDNRTYGLTKGQASPTSEERSITKINPHGVISYPLDPIALAVSQSCSFVGQGTSADPGHLTGLLKNAITNRGTSLVNILQPCVTWDKVHTFKYYKENCVVLDPDHDASDRSAALNLILAEKAKIPIGVIFRTERKPFDEIILDGKTHPLRDRELNPGTVTKLYSRFS